MGEGVYVCKKWFPNDGSRKYQREDGFWMDKFLVNQIEILLKNIRNDWDFTIIITGGGEVRVGKSVLALQIAAYWAYELEERYGIKVPYDVKENIVFEGGLLIKKGNQLGQHYPYSPLVFDEAGSDLEGRKAMKTSTQDVLDFFRECGQYNMLNILVLPEYFDLPKGIALSRAICLIDVFYSVDDEGIFERGYFNFFSKRNKKYLYMKGKRELDYKAHPYNERGRFRNFYPLNEKEYRQCKQEALSRRETKKRNKFQMQRDACWFIFNQDLGWTQEKIARIMEEMTGIYIDRTSVSNGIKHYQAEIS